LTKDLHSFNLIFYTTFPLILSRWHQNEGYRKREIND
jgi:hypothetical protein